MIRPPNGTFKKIDSGYRGSCAVELDGTANCWGTESFNNSINTPFKKFEKISIFSSVCGIIEGTQKIECWGPAMEAPPTSNFLDVSVANTLNNFGCAIKSDQTMLGDNFLDQTKAPEGKFTQVATGENYGCAVDIEGKVICWGRNDVLQAEPPIR